MLQRGARKFIFMGRSGTSKLAAKNTVAGLRAAGAEVEVVQGDVACYSDVERAVMAAKGPIGGLVHAAMSIHVSFNSIFPGSEANLEGCIIQRDYQREMACRNEPKSPRHLESLQSFVHNR